MEESVTLGAGLGQITSLEREPEALREVTVVDGDLAPPDAVVVDEVVIRVGRARLAGKPDGGTGKDLGLAHGCIRWWAEKHPGRGPCREKSGRRELFLETFVQLESRASCQLAQAPWRLHARLPGSFTLRCRIHSECSAKHELKVVPGQLRRVT